MFCKPFYLSSVFIHLLCGVLLWHQPTSTAVWADGFDRWRDVHCGASVACPLRDGPALKCSNENTAKTLHSQRPWLWALVWNASPLISPRLIAAVLLVFVLLPAREPPFMSRPFPFISALSFFLFFFFSFLHHELRACLKMTKSGKPADCGRNVRYILWEGCWILIEWNREGLGCFTEALETHSHTKSCETSWQTMVLLYRRGFLSPFSV